MKYSSIEQLAIDSFKNNETSLLPNHDYLLSYFDQFKNPENTISFQEAFSKISLKSDIQSIAILLSNVERKTKINDSRSFLELIKLFHEVEARIRYSIFKESDNAPHHLSKLLETKKAKNVLDENEIKCLLAVVADPKGLNLRNLITHGFCYDVSMGLTLIKEIKSLIFPKLKNFKPVNFNFNMERELFKYNRFRVYLPEKLNGIKKSKFPLLDDNRYECLNYAYELFEEERYIDSLMLLIPIFEHSLRRYAVIKGELELDKLCASPDEHFLTLKECYKYLPEDLSNCVVDLFFAPDGPRIRDRIMHTSVDEIPREFAMCVFVLFEECCNYCDSSSNIFYWNFAFHPARYLEYEIYLNLISYKSKIQEIDLLKLYNQNTFQTFIECAICLLNSKKTWKNNDATILMDGPFQMFVISCILYIIGQKTTNSTIKNLLGLSYAPNRMEIKNDFPRLKYIIEERVKSIHKYLPFISSELDISFFSIEKYFGNEEILLDALNFVKSKVSQTEI